MDELEDNRRKLIQMKLLSLGKNPGSLEDIDLDQYSSEEDSRSAMSTEGNREIIIIGNSSDDGGSDSSADDGLPKHLEFIAAQKVDQSMRRSSPLVMEFLGTIEKSEKENQRNEECKRNQTKRRSR